jgi:tetratricopeptide (TPR) repeat protein
MKKYITIVCTVLLAVLSVSAQNSEQDYLNRYNLLLKHLGPSGVGIETLLDKWEAAYPEDINMILGKFSYYFAKSQNTEVVRKEQPKFLGQSPVMTLKDSLGHPVNYFEETFFADSLFGKAEYQIDKIIKKYPDRLDFRFLKVSALIAYEKESPDMALSELKALVNYNCIDSPSWKYPNVEVDQDFFKAAIQDFCFAFYKTGTASSYSAFKDISELMLKYYPVDPLFMDNMGSYYLVAAGNPKMALKYYNKVLKNNPGDITAIKNSILLARNEKNRKLEKKSLQRLVKYSQDSTERKSAEIRLESLHK